METETKPILWHIPVSHYNEKVRWALAYKGVEHERRRPPPPLHMAVSFYLTRGKHYTFPVLQLDGRRIGDSTAIIAALEQRFPKPPLYPADAEERARALALEDWFDEELGPHIRLVGFHEVLRDRELLDQFASGQLPRRLRRLRRPMAAGLGAFVSLRYGVKSEEAAELGRRKVLEALDRLERELGGRQYLVGDRFTVADLTAAALFYALVAPPEGPRVLTRQPKGLEAVQRGLSERPGFRWVEEMFRRHRK
jgi:glutathione S-transferase